MGRRCSSDLGEKAADKTIKSLPDKIISYLTGLTRVTAIGHAGRERLLQLLDIPLCAGDPHCDTTGRCGADRAINAAYRGGDGRCLRG